VRSKSAIRRRGFTLVELMIAVLIAAFTVLVAANVASVVVRQAAKGRQATDFNSRARVIGKQLRADVRLAGIGSTGAVTANPGSAVLGAIITGNTPVGDFPAIPAVAGCNNVASAGILAGSDVIQLIVANPTMHGTTELTAAQGQTALTMVDAAPLADPSCTMLYIVDHSTPGGNGRTQLAMRGGVGGNVVTLNDPLNFTVQSGSDVMCGRVSTYWVGDPNGDGYGDFLARSDLTGPATPICAGVFLPTGAGPQDMVAPGVVDLQIAYAFSAEVFRNNGDPLPANAEDRWAFKAGGGGVPAAYFGATAFNWFEVRMVRFNILTKRMRAIDTSAVQVPVTRAEDGAPAMGSLPAAVAPEWLTTTEVLTNLRYFDSGMPAGVQAEPY
jgi:prepilin-type N-terminal cleavage/methylation domain-containing protein